MKSFKKHKEELNAKDQLLMDIFDFDEDKIEFSEEFKNRIVILFNEAVQARIENDFEIIDGDEPEPVIQRENYIEELASRI